MKAFFTSFAFRATRRCLGPKIPIMGPVISESSASFQNALHAATLLTKDSFIQRLYTFSRSNFDPSQSEAAYVQLLELSLHRLPHVSPKVLHEHMHLAFVAGLYHLSVELFYLCIQRESKLLMLSEYVVDSAYALLSCNHLLQMASYCSSKCLAASRDREGGRDLFAEILLLRIFWRTICLYEHICSEEYKKSESNCRAATISSDAEKIFGILRKSFPPRSAVGELSFNSFFRLSQRHIKYDTSGGDGEMMFYRECLSKNILLPPTTVSRMERNSVEDGAVSLPASVSPMLTSEISEVELFYATLIGTCISGRHVSAALNYFDCAKKSLAECYRNLVVQDRSSGPSPSAPISEYVVYRLLSALQSNKENERIVQIARSLISEYSSLSISVWSIVLVSAGETRAGDVALQAYSSAVSQVQSFSGHAQDKRGIEYLLQTALNALSKCQIPFFEENYLKVCRVAGLLHCTDEFYFSCLLQEAHNSMNPKECAEKIKERMNREGIPLTGALASRFLKIYLRTEDEEYLSMYHHATKKLRFFRRPWIDGLLLWADRRRYALSQDQRKYILEEVRERLGPNAKEHLGGLRTQCALLEYDYSVLPCQHFLEQKLAPKEEPTVQDPRVHFILRRRTCIIRGLCGIEEAGGPATTRLVNGGLQKGEIAALHNHSNSSRLNNLSRVAFVACRPLVVPHCREKVEKNAFHFFLSDVLYGLQLTNNFIE